jgi:hypothetical protein
MIFFPCIPPHTSSQSMRAGSDPVIAENAGTVSTAGSEPLQSSPDDILTADWSSQNRKKSDHCLK